MPSTRVHSYFARLASSYVNSPSATQINDEDQVVTSTRASKQSPELSAKLSVNREIMAVVTASYCCSSEADL